MYPDARCYGNAMRACAAGGNWQLSLALLNTMKKEGVTRTAFNYNIAMQVGGVSVFFFFFLAACMACLFCGDHHGELPRVLSHDQSTANGFM